MYGKTYVRFILNRCSNNLSMYTNTEAYVANDIKDPKDIDVHGEYSRRPVFKVSNMILVWFWTEKLHLLEV